MSSIIALHQYCTFRFKESQYMHIMQSITPKLHKKVSHLIVQHLYGVLRVIHSETVWKSTQMNNKQSHTGLRCPSVGCVSRTKEKEICLTGFFLRQAGARLASGSCAF